MPPPLFDELPLRHVTPLSCYDASAAFVALLAITRFRHVADFPILRTAPLLC